MPNMKADLLYPSFHVAGIPSTRTSWSRPAQHFPSTVAYIYYEWYENHLFKLLWSASCEAGADVLDVYEVVMSPENPGVGGASFGACGLVSVTRQLASLAALFSCVCHAPLLLFTQSTQFAHNTRRAPDGQLFPTRFSPLPKREVPGRQVPVMPS